MPKLQFYHLDRVVVYQIVAPTKSSYLDTLVAGKAITIDSKNWLIGALDPFHDFNFSPEGLPDTYSGPTVVQFIKKKLILTAPAGTVGTWDAHIFTAPLMSTENGSYGLYEPGVFSIPAPAELPMGTINAYCVPAGTKSLPIKGTTAYTAPYELRCISPCDNGNDYSMMRIIGGGFEVHNDTPELYKNGTVSVYSQASQYEKEFTRFSYAVDTDFGGDASKARMPPQYANDAVQLVNTRTWSALDGCYVPFVLDLSRSHFQQATSAPLILNEVDSSAAYGTTTAAFVLNIEEVNGYYRSKSPLRMAGLETVGAYFSGLTKETVLTLDVRFIVEVAPTQANTTLVSLASPSSQYDPLALELYSRAVRELPPGVKVSANAAGDWWRVVSGAIKVASPIASKFGPYGQAASAIMSGAGVIGDRIVENRLKKKIARIEQQEKQKAEEGRAGTKNQRANDLKVTRPPGKSVGGNWKAIAKAAKV